MTDYEIYRLKIYYERLVQGKGYINVLQPEEREELASLLIKQIELHRKLSAFV